MQIQNDVIIAGGGLAGLVAAIHLSRAGLKVALFEKHAYPLHKVCGEYISNEVLPYLQWLDADPLTLKPSLIDRFQFSNFSGKVLDSRLPLGGFGISRYTLDHFLMQQAIKSGCTFIRDKVTTLSFQQDHHVVKTAINGEFTARLVLGAFGKRTSIDQQLNRPFIKQRSPWLAVKAHYNGEFASDMVALHQFKGGYCGVSRVEDQRINICYLANQDVFKNYKNLQDFQEQVLFKNKHLEQIISNATVISDAPLAISQLSFEKKEAVKDHIILIGDAAGLIHPLCGNGMAMAIHSAKIAAELIIPYLGQKQQNRHSLEKQYNAQWQYHFRQRLAMGRFVSAIMQQESLNKLLFKTLGTFPALLPALIRKTHGQPLKIAYEN